MTPRTATDTGLVGVLALLFAVFALSAEDRSLWWLFVASAIGIGFVQVVLYVRDGISLPSIVVLAVLARLLLYPLPPILSDDVYRYLWDGWLLTDGINPFRYLPNDPALAHYQANPLFTLMNSPDRPTIYPPVSQGVFYLAGLFVRPLSWEAGYLVLKLLTVLIESTGLMLLARVVSSRSFMLLSLSPVILIASAGQAHSDALLVGAFGAAFWAWKTDRRLLSVMMVTAAGWIKLYPLAFLPFMIRRLGWKAAALSLGFSILLWLPLAASYVPIRMVEALDLYVRYFEFNAGPYYAVKEVFLLATGEDWSKQLGPFFRWFFVAGFAGLVWYDWKRGLSLWKACVLVTGLYLLTATTIHPWYFVGILTLISMRGRLSAHWQWVSVMSIGTYLLYVGGPYWLFVWVCWSGFIVLFIVYRRDEVLQQLLRLRASQKVALIQPFMNPLDPDSRVLDLGAAEGYVGRHVADTYGCQVELADVRKAARVDLPEIQYDGTRLPFQSNSFDVVILSYVLHHSSHPELVLKEAARVSRGQVVILESIYASRRELLLLRALDKLANHLRSDGTMDPSQLDHRTAEEWLDLAHGLASGRVAHREIFRPWHRQLVLSFTPAKNN